VQSLFGSVVDTGDTRQTEQTSQTERNLVVLTSRIRRINVSNPFFHVVIVEKCDEVTRCVAMRTQHVGFDLFPEPIHINQHGRRGQAFHNGLEVEKKRIIQSCVDADHVCAARRRPTYETGDLLFGVADEDFAKSEEILLSDAQCELPNRIAE
jgi:hypothetical protein